MAQTIHDFKKNNSLIFGLEKIIGLLRYVACSRNLNQWGHFDVTAGEANFI